jgi:peroxiredoxin
MVLSPKLMMSMVVAILSAFTYIIDAEGKISHVDDKVNTASHASDILCVVG